MSVDNFIHLLSNVAMIINIGDLVKIDGHWKKFLNGKSGTVINVDYDKELSLFDDGKIIMWIKNDYLEPLRRFYEIAN